MAPSVVICQLLPTGNFVRSGLCLLPTVIFLVACDPAARIVEDDRGRPGSSDPAMIWSIPTASGCRLLLAGSLHLLGPEDHPLPQVLLQSLDSCATLFTETGALSESQSQIERFVRSRGILPTGESLQDQELGAEVARQLEAYLELRPGVADRLRSLRPWMASLQIAMESYRRAGMQRVLGVDAVLLERATRRGMCIAALESPTRQLSGLADLSRQEQVQLLGGVLGEVLDGTALEDYLNMRQLWRRGDLSGFSQHVEAQLVEGHGSIEARMLDERNAHFAERIAELAGLPPGEAEDCLVLVGAGHLVGARGLLARLARRLDSPPVRIMPAGSAEQALSESLPPDG